jgi:hypothetical protein
VSYCSRKDTPGVPDQDPPGTGTPPGTGNVPATAAADAAQAAWRALVPGLAGAPRMRVSRDGGRTYPRRHEQPLATRNPGQPVTVPVYDAMAATGRLLAADFDTSRAVGHADPARVVAADAADFAAFVARLGGRAITDVSPSGGRHVLVLFAAALPWRELRDLTRALALRYRTLDPAPMAGLGGQIRPPGARHKSAGWQVLTIPLDAAVDAVAQPCGPGVWQGLLREFAAELATAEPVAEPGDVPPGAVIDDDGTPWLPRRGGRVPLNAGPAAIARTGSWPRGRYAGRSEARMAVVTAAAACGWRLAEVRAEVAAGRWAGVADLYARAREPRRMARLLPAEWRRAVALLAGEENPRTRHTSDSYSRPPGMGADVVKLDLEAEYGRIRMWVTAADLAIADPHRRTAWGGQVMGVRLVLAAVGQAAMVAGSTVIEFGVRNLALQAGVSSRTVARALQVLREEADPLLDVVSRHRLRRADRYELRIPDAYVAAARWRRRRAGRIEAIHCAFETLGGPAALVYSALGPAEARGAEVARAARLSESATMTALKVLGEYGLAERGSRGWRRGPVTLEVAAAKCGGARRRKEREAAYAEDRRNWQALIASWLAGPDVAYRDDGPVLAIDDILEHLEPPPWLDADPSPPVR